MKVPENLQEQLKRSIIWAEAILGAVTVAYGCAFEEAAFVRNSIAAMGGLIIGTLIILYVEVFARPKYK